MIDAIFVVRLDDFQGFLVEKRYPPGLSLNEKILNLVFFDQQKGKKEQIKFSEIDELRVLSFKLLDHPETTVCFALSEETTPDQVRGLVRGMGRLILELLNRNPELVDLGEILRKKSVLPERTEEQRTAEVFLTPSTALVLENMQQESIQTAAKLSMWLKGQTQSDDINIRDAFAPLINNGLAKVEIVKKTQETVFFLKDIFCYRAPPIESLQTASVEYPDSIEKYRQSVKKFFSPPPPEKGYNPTIPVEDSNSPIIEDRKIIASILADSIDYVVLSSLREKPMSVKQISENTAFPESVVQSSLWDLQSNRVVTFFEHEGLWALITNPTIESFMPIYALAVISRKLLDKEVASDIAARYLELLTQHWGEPVD